MISSPFGISCEGRVVCIALDGAGSLMFHGAHRKHGISLPYARLSFSLIRIV